MDTNPMDSQFIKFVSDSNNLIIGSIALISGSLLLFSHFQNQGVKISPLKLTQLMNQKEAMVIDIRETDQFKKGHIPDAKSIPIKTLTSECGKLSQFKNKTFVVVCENGTQSHKAVSQLKKAGFQKVHLLEGGLVTWETQGLPKVK
jgi:rhodanese-related sulfurtransferase